MKASIKRTRGLVNLALITVGLIAWMVLPGLPAGRAVRSAHSSNAKSAAQKQPSSGLDASRQAALEKLYAELRAGGKFSQEEGNILRRFGAGARISELEADVLISRALYDRYVTGKEMSRTQQNLLRFYTASVSKRNTDVLDVKMAAVKRRKAAAPRTTPLVIPPNDLCGGAEVIPAGGPFPHSTTAVDMTDATVTGDPPIPDCIPDPDVSRSVWYRFTPATTGVYVISSCQDAPTGTTLEDPVIAIYTSSTSNCGGTYTQLPNDAGIIDGCGDDECVSGALQAEITTMLNAGTNYFIVVWQFGQPAPPVGQNMLQLRVSVKPPPANDTCAGAIAVTLDTPATGSTIDATNDYQLGGTACFTGHGQITSGAIGRDVVYSFIAPVAANYSIRLGNYSVGDPVMYVASTCPAATPGTPVNFNCSPPSQNVLAASNRYQGNAGPYTAEEVFCLALTAGQQIFIFVDAEVADIFGSDFTLEVNLCDRESEPPLGNNDTPGTANALSCGKQGSVLDSSSGGNDADFFSLGTPAAGSRVFALIDGVPGNSTDFDLRVTTTGDTIQYDDLNTDFAFGDLSATLAGTPTTGAATFLRVSTFDNPPPFAAEPYRLYATVQPPGGGLGGSSATSETEPNGTTAQADSATNNFFSGTLSAPGPSTDVDVFSFTAVAGDLVFLSLDGDPLRNNTPLNARLALLNGSGNLLLEVDDNGSISNTTAGVGSLTALTPFSTAESLVYRVATSGTYSARVAAGVDSDATTGTGDYLLSISRNCLLGTPSTHSISGTVSYCITPAKKVPGVVLTAVGPPSKTATTNSTGDYQVTGLPETSYTVVPMKSPNTDNTGISAFDAALVAQYVAGITTPTSCQMLAGDASNNGGLSAFDAAFIAQTVAGISNPGIARTWKFVPASRSYDPLDGNIPNENYDAVLVGDVSGNWTPAGPELSIAAPAGGGNVAVTLPNWMAAPGSTNVMVPVIVDNTTGQGIIAYDFTFTFNNSVIKVANPAAFETNGTLSQGWTITPNTSTPGQIRIVAFNTQPLMGSGILIFIKFDVVGSEGSMTPLTWTNFVFNEGTPTATLTNGSFTATAPSAVKLEKFTASSYEKGVFIEWETGFEVDNLGFNIYRMQSGQMTLITPEILAGSALVTGRAALTAGDSYGWWDDSSKGDKDVFYYLEDVDIDGTRTLHGPVSPAVVGGHPPEFSQAERLSQLGKGEPILGSPSPAQRPLRLADASTWQREAQFQFASGPAVKIAVRKEGWYRVNQSELVTAGLDPNVNPQFLQLYVDGQEVPIRISGEEDRHLDSSDSLEFYGTGVDSAVTDTRIYWLVAASQPGLRVNTVQSPGGQPLPGGFPYTIERKERSIYYSALRNGESENFFGPVIASQPVDQSLTLQHLDQSASTAVLEVAVQGVSQAAHQVKVTLNGAEVGQVACFGQARGVASISISQGTLVEGQNQIILTAIGGPSDVTLVDYVRLTYQHTFTADNDSLRFSGAANQDVSVQGFSNPDIRIIDVTDANSPQELLGTISQEGSFYSVALRLPGSGQRRLLGFINSEADQVAALSFNQPSKLATPKNGADFIIITRQQFISSLEPLRTFRQGQRMAVMIVDVEDIYDEFSFGQKSPQAIKDFLAYAKTSWKRKPAYVMLAGDASYDAKNYLGGGEWDLVPSKLLDTTYLETASDDWFADFNNDGLPELAVGRLPIRSGQEATLMVGKIIGYERGSSLRSALLVADINDGYDFEGANTALRSILPAGTRIEEVKRGQMDAATAKAKVLEVINRGVGIVNYNGHGSVELWRGNLLTSADASALRNEGRLGMFMTITCLNGYYQDAFRDSLAEALMKAQRGGAVAVWGSTGMCDAGPQAAINQEMARKAYGVEASTGRRLTVGEAAAKAKELVGDADVRRTYMLFGDPTMRLK